MKRIKNCGNPNFGMRKPLRIFYLTILFYRNGVIQTLLIIVVTDVNGNFNNGKNRFYGNNIHHHDSNNNQ